MSREACGEKEGLAFPYLPCPLPTPPYPHTPVVPTAYTHLFDLLLQRPLQLTLSFSVHPAQGTADIRAKSVGIQMVIWTYGCCTCPVPTHLLRSARNSATPLADSSRCASSLLATRARCSASDMCCPPLVGVEAAAVVVATAAAAMAAEMTADCSSRS